MFENSWNTLVNTALIPVIKYIQENELTVRYLADNAYISYKEQASTYLKSKTITDIDLKAAKVREAAQLVKKLYALDLEKVSKMDVAAFVTEVKDNKLPSFDETEHAIKQKRTAAISGAKDRASYETAHSIAKDIADLFLISTNKQTNNAFLNFCTIETFVNAKDQQEEHIASQMHYLVARKIFAAAVSLEICKAQQSKNLVPDYQFDTNAEALLKNLYDTLAALTNKPNFEKSQDVLVNLKAICTGVYSTARDNKLTQIERDFLALQGLLSLKIENVVKAGTVIATGDDAIASVKALWLSLVQDVLEPKAAEVSLIGAAASTVGSALFSMPSKMFGLFNGANNEKGDEPTANPENNAAKPLSANSKEFVPTSNVKQIMFGSFVTPIVVGSGSNATSNSTAIAAPNNSSDTNVEHVKPKSKVVEISSNGKKPNNKMN